MNEMKTFESSQFGKIRAIEQNGESWFVAADVCRALELGDVSKAISRLDDDEGARIEIPHPQNQQKLLGVNAVNEPGLYTLVLGCRKPEAKAFKRWITHEVLPAIRRTGTYSTQNDRHAAPLPPESAGGVAQLLKVLRATMKDNEQPPEVISQTVKDLCEQFGIRFPSNFVRQNPFEQMVLASMFYGK